MDAPVHHVFEKVHEVYDRVGVWLKLDALDEAFERHLPVEFCECDGVLLMAAGRCAGAGADRWCWPHIVLVCDVVGCRVEVGQN